MQPRPATSSVSSGDPVLRALLWVLAAGLVANSLLGPLVFGVIDYRFTESLVNQGIGLDAVAFAAVVPIAIAAARLSARGHRAGPVLAFIPSTFTLYMAPQYVIGPDYTGLPGNNERFFLLHLALFVLAGAVGAVAWRAIDHDDVLPRSPSSDRRRSLVLSAAAVFIVVGMYGNALIALIGGDPSTSGYQENPTSYMLIAFLDLAVVVPGFLVAAAALALHRARGRTAAYVAIGWFSLVPAAVAAMAVVMSIEDDPDASTGATIGFVVAGALFTAAAAHLYRPLFASTVPDLPRPEATGAEEESRLPSARPTRPGNRPISAERPRNGGSSRCGSRNTHTSRSAGPRRGAAVRERLPSPTTTGDPTTSSSPSGPSRR